MLFRSEIFQSEVSCFIFHLRFYFSLIISPIFLLISLSGSSIRKSENFIVILLCSFLLKFFFKYCLGFFFFFFFFFLFSQPLLYIMRYSLAFFSHLQFPRCSSPRYFTVTTLTSITGITASDCFCFSPPPPRGDCSYFADITFHAPVCMLSCFSCDPVDCPLGSSVHGIFQARKLEEVVMPSSGESSQPGDRTRIHMSPALAGVSLATSATWKAPCYLTQIF